ncbi:MAG TPA: CaiB/BaiF CoA-transferase family protein [Pseudonocardiaceae bacterium]
MSTPGSPGAPLAGLRVADLSRVLAGPYCTMLLADLGADVVKVEHPLGGDDTRAWHPPELAGQSAYFLSVNRGKRSVALDLKHEQGRAAAVELCARADVVLENFRPGVADRLGLGWEQLRARNPRLVYCSITAYPEDHPAAGGAGLDAVLQAESGLMHITGEPNGAPAKVGVAVVDVLTGLNAATAILAALHRRTATGQGTRVTVSMLGAALSGLVNVGQNALVTGTEVARYGNAHASIVPYQPFPTSDGQIMVAAGNDNLYRRLCQVIGRPDLADDPRFATNPDRVRHRETLVAELSRVFVTRTAQEWAEALRAAGVPAGKVQGVLEALRAAGPSATVTVEHPLAGPIDTIAPAFRIGTAPATAPTAPPLLGQHTREVLTELGYSAEQIADMEQSHAIGNSTTTRSAS